MFLFNYLQLYIQALSEEILISKKKRKNIAKQKSYIGYRTKFVKVIKSNSIKRNITTFLSPYQLKRPNHS